MLQQTQSIIANPQSRPTVLVAHDMERVAEGLAALGMTAAALRIRVQRRQMLEEARASCENSVELLSILSLIAAELVSRAYSPG